MWLLTRIRKWVFNHYRVKLVLLSIAWIVTVVLAIIGVKLNNYVLGIPAVISYIIFVLMLRFCT